MVGLARDVLVVVRPGRRYSDAAQSIQAWVGKQRSLASFLYLQRVTGFDPPNSLALEPETAAWFENAMTQARFYVEWGSGGSTLVADSHRVRAISVEGDRFYAEVVRELLSPTTTVRMRIPEMGITREWSTPLFRSDRKGRRYVSAPFTQMERDFPDLVLIDGRYRIACALETARRAAEADARPTLVLDDYTERPSYHVVEAYLGRPTLVGRAAIFTVAEPEIPSEVIENHLNDPR